MVSCTTLSVAPSPAARVTGPVRAVVLTERAVTAASGLRVRSTCPPPASTPRDWSLLVRLTAPVRPLRPSTTTPDARLRRVTAFSASEAAVTPLSAIESVTPPVVPLARRPVPVVMAVTAAPGASLAPVTDWSASFRAVTAPSARSGVPTPPSASCPPPMLPGCRLIVVVGPFGSTT